MLFPFPYMMISYILVVHHLFNIYVINSCALFNYVIPVFVAQRTGMFKLQGSSMESPL